MIRKLILGLALLVGAGMPLLASPARAAGDDITGWWFDETKRAGILIQPCGQQLCGKIAWLRAPLDDAGKEKLDTKNSDPKLKTRPLCQLPMIGGFNKAGEREWEDGWIYNPEDGDTYKSRMVLQDDGALRVRGFIGVPWLGKSQIWTRPPEPLTECKPA
ncbi:MAG TPA: DUF2147 domain-containing protein [Aliidongia sp.]|nr:DUF2147 domain-containing protein [Aliidongia sp.]